MLPLAGTHGTVSSEADRIGIAHGEGMVASWHLPVRTLERHERPAMILAEHEGVVVWEPEAVAGRKYCPVLPLRNPAC